MADRTSSSPRLRGLCCSRRSQHRDFDALWQLVNVYCNVVVTKRVWRDAVPTYFGNLVSWVVDLKACAELMAGCRDVAPTEQSLDSAVRSIGHEAQERSSSLIQRNFWTLPTILNKSLDGTIRVQ
jgi:hypothetical protein